MLVVTFTTLCLRCLPQQLARELIFYMNLVEFMVVLFGCHVLISIHGMYRYPFSIRPLVSPILVDCSSGLRAVHASLDSSLWSPLCVMDDEPQDP
jgi:hypothetical protein